MIYTRRYQLDSGWKKRLEALDMNPTAVLREANLAVDLLERKNLSVTSAEYYRLWEAMTRLVKTDAPFPLLVARS